MIQDNNFDQKLLETIKDKKISPRPKWQFFLKNFAIVMAGVFSFLFGAVSFCLIIYLAKFDEWDAYRKISAGSAGFWLIIIPFFWLITLGLFIFLLIYNIKKTKKGYRYSLPLIILLAVSASLALGGVFHLTGLGEKIDDVLGQNAPFYEQIINPGVRFWSTPTEGRLAGLVESQVDEEQYIVIDMTKKEWNVITGEMSEGKQEINIGRPARFIGEQTAEKEFTARKILPMRSGRGIFNRPRPMGPMMINQCNNSAGVLELPNHSGGFLEIFTKHPELRAAFIEDIVNDKDKAREIIGRDPQFIDHLKEIGIGDDIIKKLELNKN